MATLEQLRPNLLELPPEDAFTLFSEYYSKREKDLTSIQIQLQLKEEKKIRKKSSITSKSKSNSKTKAVSVSPEQLDLLKKLGLI